MTEHQIVKLLLEEQKRQGLSKKEMMRRTGLSASAIRMWERRAVSPKLDSIILYAKALGYELLAQPETEA